jgi:hypothetical protein
MSFVIVFGIWGMGALSPLICLNITNKDLVMWIICWPKDISSGLALKS